MRQAYIVMIALAAGYLVLALYGKYRTIRDDYRHAVEEELKRHRQDPPV